MYLLRGTASGLQAFFKALIVAPQLTRFRWGLLDSMAVIDDRDIAIETCGLSSFLKMVLDGELGRIWHLKNISIRVSFLDVLNVHVRYGSLDLHACSMLLSAFRTLRPLHQRLSFSMYI